MKALIQSKTFWLGVVQFAIGVISLFTTTFGTAIPSGVVSYLLMASGVLTVLLRAITSTSISGILPPSFPG